MGTVALEFVPPEVAETAEASHDRARQEAAKVRRLLDEHGLGHRVNRLLIPGMIEEESDRPVPLKRRMDPLDVWRAAKEELTLAGSVTQVTSFDDEASLRRRFRTLAEAGIDRAVCVGVPRTLSDGEGGGVPPTDALNLFKREMPSLGVILIPTRDGEVGRFKFKLDKGADFALTQLLYSDRIVAFLKEMAGETEARPEILLSFGFVPKAETRVGLIRWLIKDENALARAEAETVAALADLPPAEKRARLVDLYARVTDELQALDFPLGIHLECPYGFTEHAFATFRALLDTWTPP